MKKSNKLNIEDKIWKFVDSHIYLIFFIIITILSLFIRYQLLKYKSGDYDLFLKPWFDELKMYGGLSGLSYNIGNYTPIYMTLLALLTYLPFDSLISIKIVSIIFDYVGAFFVYKIILELFKNKEYKKKIGLLIYSFYLLLPTVFLNSAYWSQCDGIYTAFIIISIYFLIKNNFLKGIIFFSIALVFKFQAIFIFPLYVLLYFSDKKIKFKYFLIIPLTIFIFSIPKIIFTGDLFCGFKVYFEQSGSYNQYLTLNLPNIYSIYLRGYDANNPNLINSPIKEFNTICIIITLIIFMVIALLVIKNKIKFNNNSIIEFALWSILICTFFLPQMHERYLFMGDIISLIYFTLNKRKYYIPILIEIISLNGYMYLLFGGNVINISTLSILYLIMIIIYSKNMYSKYFTD